MTVSRRIGLAVLWTLSVVAATQWTTRAQGVATPGVEVRFLPGAGKPGTPHGTLLANFNGQWLPVTLDLMALPDPNSLVPR